MAENEPHLSGTDASAGRKTNVVRYILGVSLAAIVIIFAILLIMNR
jgi:predicted secreted protein